MGGWFWLHILAQLLAVLAAAAGVVIAILAFGWKSVPGEKLYAPHKWTGIGVMGMALIQLVTAPFRPKLESKRRGCWNFVHHVWGRVAVLGGMGNCILGAILVHDYKGESYISWLVPCCAVIGFVCLLGLVMEAFKIQVRVPGRGGRVQSQCSRAAAAACRQLRQTCSQRAHPPARPPLVVLSLLADATHLPLPPQDAEHAARHGGRQALQAAQPGGRAAAAAGRQWRQRSGARGRPLLPVGAALRGRR